MSPYEHERRRQRTAWILGGGLVAMAVLGAIADGVQHFQHPEATRPTHSRASDFNPRHAQHPIAQSHLHAPAQTAAATLAASFRAATHQPVPNDMETVTVPWALNQTWAIDPNGITSSGHPNPILWFGEQTGSQPWRWIPSTLPGALNPNLPKPVYDSLQLAWDLTQGTAGPTLSGSIQWASVTGHVGLPAGWTLQPLTGLLSPLGHATIQLTVWEPSYTGTFSGFYGVNTLWDAHNAPTGTHGLAGLMAAPGPLTAIAHTSVHP